MIDAIRRVAETRLCREITWREIRVRVVAGLGLAYFLLIEKLLFSTEEKYNKSLVN